MAAEAEKNGQMEATSTDVTRVVTGGRPECFQSTLQEVLFVFIATMAVAAPAYVSGSITVVSSFIERDLNMSDAELTWLQASSSLTSGAFLLFFGRTADLFGRKNMIIVSFFFFAIFCLCCGFANSAITLDVLNGMLGICAASAVPPAIGILGTVYEKNSPRKNAAFACFSAGNPVGFVLGMIFGGIATQLLGWRASFWLVAIIYGLLTIVCFYSIPTDLQSRRTWSMHTVKEMDLVGTVLTIAGIGMFSAALSLGDSAPDGWRTSYVLALLVIGIALMTIFVVWEIYYPYPLMPMSIWKNSNFSLLIIILSLGFMAFSPAAYFVSLFFQRVWHWSPLMTAVHLLPMAVVGILTNVVAGLILHRVSNKVLMFIGATAFTAAYLLFALNRSRDSYWAFCFPALCLTVIGADLEFNVANMYVMSSLPKEQASIAGSILQTVTKLFTTVGYGIITAVFSAVARNPTMSGYYAAQPETQPYSAAFYYALACSALSVAFVPWLTIRTQGGKRDRGPKHERPSQEVEVEEQEDGDGEGDSLHTNQTRSFQESASSRRPAPQSLEKI